MVIYLYGKSPQLNELKTLKQIGGDIMKNKTNPLKWLVNWIKKLMSPTIVIYVEDINFFIITTTHKD